MTQPIAWIRHHKQYPYFVHIDTVYEDALKWLNQFKDGYAWLEPLYSSNEKITKNIAKVFLNRTAD